MAEQIWAAVIQGAATIAGSLIGRKTFQGGQQSPGETTIDLSKIQSDERFRHRFPQPRLTRLRCSYEPIDLSQFRLKVYIEAENPAKITAKRGGITLNIPEISSPEIMKSVSPAVYGRPQPYIVEPGGEIWGYLRDSSTGPMDAHYIMIENWSEPWDQRMSIFLDAELVVPFTCVTLLVRAWMNWDRPEGGQEIANDPYSPISSPIATLNQQNFPVYAVEIDMGQNRFAT
jgi:hypothetical protein